MAGNARQVINMANSIVGVSILSMPFCFRESGLLLGVILVLVTGFITKKTCMFLIRSAIMARRRSYEFLAFHVFGVSGKLFVEMCMILFLFGICISFYVVMGDLAPAIVARFMSVENSSSLRYTLLIGIAVLVILPLCLLRNLDNLASMSAFSIMFYFFLVVVVFWHAFPKLWDGTWIHIAELWRPAGALQILPILSLALACQSNVFEIYDSVPDPDVPKMRFVVNHAVNLCSALYISVGFLGYVAFVDKDISGNIIMSFPDSGLTEGIKMFFAVSLAISFPLMIFPCRTSIHSLIYRRSNPSSFDLVGNYMPESRFKAITFGILLSSLVIGILIPNIELVLGLLGSTMGMLIATILPSLLFIKVNTKASTERLLAQGIMLMGLMLIVTGTYLNLAHIREVQELPLSPTELAKANVDPQMPKIMDVGEGEKDGKAVPAGVAEDSATRKEPVAPEPPPEENVGLPKEKGQSDGEDVEKAPDKVEEKNNKKDNGNISNNKEKKKDSAGNNEGDLLNTKNEGDTLHPDAIQKEEKENEEEKDKVEEGKDIEKKQAEILQKMEVQHQEQQQILEEQKKILQELKDHKLKQEEEEARKQEEEKAKNSGAGNVVAVQDSQKLEGNNAGFQVGIPLGVDSLVDNHFKPSLNQNNLLLNPQPINLAESNIYHPEKEANAVAPSPKAPVPTVDQSILSKVNSNPAVDLNVKINPQLPMAYYHANAPSFVGNGIVPAGNQVPADSVAGYAAVAGNVAAQSAQANIPVQSGSEVNVDGKPLAPVVGMPVEQAPVNVVPQPVQAAVPGQLVQLPVQGQPLQAAVQAALQGQPAQVVGQGQPVQAVMQGQPVLAAVQGQPVQVAVQGQPLQAVVQSQPVQAAVQSQPVQVVMQGQPVLGQHVQAPVQGLPVQAPVQGLPVQAPVQSQPVQAPVQGQPVQAPVQGLPVQAPVQSQPVQAPVQGLPVQAPVQGLPVQAPVQGQPVQAPVQGQPVQAPVQGQPVLGQPVQAPVQGQPVKAALQSQPMKAAVQSQPVQVTLQDQPVKAAVQSQPAQAAVPVQAGQVVILNQPAGAVAPDQGLQSTYVGQPKQPNLPAQPAQVALPGPIAQGSVVGQPVPIANHVGQPAANEVIAGLPAGAPAPLSHIEDKLKVEVVGESQPSPRKEDERMNKKKKQMKESISQNSQGKVPKTGEISKSNSLKTKAGKVDSKKEKLKNVKGDISGRGKDIKKTQHDEERRKRDVDSYSNFDLPQGEILKELKWKEFGDVVYDTRHLLWTGRSRRKKRNKGRDEDYYWDET
ncbi:solute carrier family 38 member 10 isoform X2 [Macrobrachium rosenbergii]|uniref:solute carrier family 38 member 10 isoform X2 n=1 Tax=Macrobrachium rosenbergii TaxID=79674 RepID=UPI0034D54A1C